MMNAMLNLSSAKPVIACTTIITANPARTTWKMMKQIDRPSRLSPATARPATPEPRNAILSAPGLPPFAASAVRPLAPDSTAMTTRPAPSEQSAPRTKQSPASQPRSLRSATATSTKTAAANSPAKE